MWINLFSKDKQNKNIRIVLNYSYFWANFKVFHEAILSFRALLFACEKSIS